VQGDRPKKKWADPKRFVERRTRKAAHPSEHLAGYVVYAHYKRRAWLDDRGAVQEKTFLGHLEKIYGAPATHESSGAELYACVVLDAEAEQKKRARKDRLDEVRGKVRIVEALNFCDGVLEAGSVVDWMAPTENEKRDLERDRQGQGQGAHASWLVVSWSGKRRRVPGDAVRRIV